MSLGDAVAKIKKTPLAQPAARVKGLDDLHFRKIIGSGLTVETIMRTAAYTEHDTVRLRLLLGGSPAVAPALILPFFDRNGKRIDYAVARLIPPLIRRDGSEAKYLMPTGMGNQAYFPPFPSVWEALNNPGGPLVITEGILKALAATQAGVPCIGLMGMQNWSQGRTDRTTPRCLIPDLSGIDWRDRTVLIVCDADPVRKPGVNHGAAELARLLTEHGAECCLARPPFGPTGGDALPAKQAVDDYIVRCGEGAFREWAEKHLTPPPVRNLSECRAEMAASRIAARIKISDELMERLGSPVDRKDLLDCGPPGVGKTFADVEAIRRQEDISMKQAHTLQELLDGSCQPKSITYVPTTQHCDEAVEQSQRQQLPVVAYPKLTPETCERYDEASAVMSRGLAFQFVLCPECPCRDGCNYIEQRKRADNSDHVVATQARGVHTLPRWSGVKRNRIVLNEVPLDIIRPNYVVERGLKVVALIASQAEHNATDANDRGFFRHMAGIAVELDGWLNGADRSADIPLPPHSAHLPKSAHRDLNDAILELGTGAAPPAEAMRLALASASGDLTMVGVAVDERPDKGNGVKIVRKLVGMVRVDLPRGCWINDATADPGEIEAALGRPVVNITPRGCLLRHHPVLQIIPDRDVTKARQARSVLPILRGLLCDLRHPRIGLLTHKKLAKELPALLSEAERKRLAKVHYFGGGHSRGSNRWIQECDALIVLGTPRIGAETVRIHLYRIGKVRAFERTREQAAWGWDWWSGITETGRRRTVKCRHYADHDWHAAYCSLVRGELLQAIGRGRGILPEGIPVYVVTNENLAPIHDDDGRNGFPLADEGRFAPLTGPQAAVLTIMRERSQLIFKTKAIAEALGKSPIRATKLLVQLEKARRVIRIGQRGGWSLPR
jgi:hypothetical protein